MRRAGFLALAAATAVLAGCSASSQGRSTRPVEQVKHDAAAPGAHQPLQRRDLAACATMPPYGPISRNGRDLSFSSGSMHVQVSPDGAPPVCGELAKSGPADPQVPPDTMLFTFAGTGGDGAQLEFYAVDLTGGVLPPLGDGYVPRVGPLNHPINARVGAAVDGKYYRAEQCALTLTEVHSETIRGRFDCPRATLSADPFAPAEDVDHNVDDSIPPPATASLSGWFALKH